MQGERGFEMERVAKLLLTIFPLRPQAAELTLCAQSQVD